MNDIFADAEGRRLYIPPQRRDGAVDGFSISDAFDPVSMTPGSLRRRLGRSKIAPRVLHQQASHDVGLDYVEKVVGTIDVGSRPDGIIFDPYSERVWIFSKTPPYATVVDAKAGQPLLGTLDLGGGPEQAVSDSKSTIYVNISTNANIAVVDAKNIKVTAHYDVSSKAAHCGGLAFGVKKSVLFACAACPHISRSS